MKTYAFLLDILLLLLVTVTGFLLWNSSQYSPSNSEESNNKQGVESSSRADFTEDYDAFAKGIVGTQFGENGEKKYQLSAPDLHHYKNQNLTLIDKPTLYIYNQGNYPWTITANHAKAINGLREVSLIDNVQVSGIQTKDYKGSILTSSKINYYPKKNEAITYQPVTIKQPGLTLNSIGMDILFNESNIKLLSKVEGQYDPKHS